MFALVLWKESYEISVVSINDVRTGNKNLTKAKWGKEWYPVDVLKTSERKEWLESLEVSTEGEIITPKRRSSISTDLLIKKRQDTSENKTTQSTKKAVQIESDTAISKKRAVFEKDSSEEESEDDSTSNDDETESVRDAEMPEIEDNGEYDDEQAQNSQKQHPCICPDFPSLTPNDMRNYLNRVLQLAHEIHCKKNMVGSQSETSTIKPVSISTGNDEIELVQGSGVMVNEYKLKSLHDLYKKNPRELARQLMKLLIGEDILRESSPTGKNHHKPIPTAIFEGVERYINENAPRKRYKLSHKIYRETLTAQCATLRNQQKYNESYQKLKEMRKVNKTANENDENMKEPIEENEIEPLEETQKLVKMNENMNKKKKRKHVLQTPPEPEEKVESQELPKKKKNNKKNKTIENKENDNNKKKKHVLSQ